MADDSLLPATKADMKMLMETLANMYKEIQGLRGEWREDIREEIQISEDRQHQNFMVLFEDLRHDMIGTHKDKIQQHEDRIKRLEIKTGLATAA